MRLLWWRRSLLPVVGFVVTFGLLQSLWQWARGGWLERLWVDALTVRAGVALIELLTPTVGAAAAGSRIVAPGGGLNILNGCDGTDMLFVLLAAIGVAPLPWRTRLWAVAAGTLFVFALNLARIVALFYAYRTDPALFDLLHNTVAPVLLIAFAGVAFQVLLSCGGRRSAAA